LKKFEEAQRYIRMGGGNGEETK